MSSYSLNLRTSLEIFVVLVIVMHIYRQLHDPCCGRRLHLLLFLEIHVPLDRSCLEQLEVAGLLFGRQWILMVFQGVFGCFGNREVFLLMLSQLFLIVFFLYIIYSLLSERAPMAVSSGL